MHPIALENTHVFDSRRDLTRFIETFVQRSDVLFNFIPMIVVVEAVAVVDVPCLVVAVVVDVGCCCCFLCCCSCI